MHAPFPTSSCEPIPQSGALQLTASLYMTGSSHKSSIAVPKCSLWTVIHPDSASFLPVLDCRQMLTDVDSHPIGNRELPSFCDLSPPLMLQEATIGSVVRDMGWWQLATRGLGLRIVMIGTLTATQWAIYDSFKVYVGL